MLAKVAWSVFETARVEYISISLFMQESKDFSE